MLRMYSPDGFCLRFHPLITKHQDTVAWWICDGRADTEHSLPVPYINEPCESYEEACELCAILNEQDA